MGRADTLGSPVTEAHDQVGGMSPGCATRLVCEDGTRAFVKAVGFELNPRDAVSSSAARSLALTLIGSHELWADLLASYDDGDWVAVLLEDVEGEHPDLDDDATMDLLLRETERFSAVLAERVPDPPAPDPDNGGLNDLRAQLPRLGGLRRPGRRDPAGPAPRLDPARHRHVGAPGPRSLADPRRADW